MTNQYVNKVIIGTEVKLDLTQDDITPDKLAEALKPMTNLAHLSLVQAQRMLTPAMQLPLLQKF